VPNVLTWNTRDSSMIENPLGGTNQNGTDAMSVGPEL
jgi:hypothetical protein